MAEVQTFPLSVKQSQLVAAAGEYYILARLSLCGKLAAQAPRGVPSADVIVSSVEGDRLCAIQVKTRTGKGGDGGWHMKKKHEDIESKQLFYCFVDFGNSISENPKVYVVPSSITAEAIRLMHSAWLARPGKKGQAHNDSEFRRFMPDFTLTSGDQANPYIQGWLDPYYEAWHLLP
jgi:hypothetical protein